MHEAPDPLYWPVYWAIVVIWVAYGLTFLARVPRPDKRQRVRSNGSLLGIVLASAGFPIVWTIRRPTSSPLLTAAPALSYAIETAAVVTGIASVWLTLASIRTLGKQWNLRAAIVNDHALVTTGPYAHVRNPMYLSMLGIMVATGIASATWLALAVAMLLGIVGTMIRIHFEELLLVDAFGAAFDAYRARVPALFPRL